MQNTSSRKETQTRERDAKTIHGICNLDEGPLICVNEF